ELIGTVFRPDLTVLADRLLKDAVLERLCSKPDLEQLSECCPLGHQLMRQWGAPRNQVTLQQAARVLGTLVTGPLHPATLPVPITHIGGSEEPSPRSLLSDPAML